MEPITSKHKQSKHRAVEPSPNGYKILHTRGSEIIVKERGESV